MRRSEWGHGGSRSRLYSMTLRALPNSALIAEGRLYFWSGHENGPMARTPFQLSAIRRSPLGSRRMVDA